MLYQSQVVCPVTFLMYLRILMVSLLSIHCSMFLPFTFASITFGLLSNIILTNKSDGFIWMPDNWTNARA